MNISGHNTRHKLSTIQGGNTESKLEAIGWGLFFLWVGLAFIFGFGSEIGLLGIGIITLVMQWLRKYFGLTLDGFWVVIGLIFTLGGLGALFEANIQIVPVTLVLAGIFLLASVFKPRSKWKKPE